MPYKSYFRSVATAIVFVLIITLVATMSAVSAAGDDDPVIPLEKAELKYPNLGSALDQLVASVEEGQATAQDAAEGASIFQGESVAVTIHLSGHVDDVVQFLEDNGGDPRNVGEDYIEAYVPAPLLGPVSQQPGVLRVREIVPPQPTQISQRIVGNGPALHGSQAWNRAGFSGQGIKVGVVDLSFRDVTTLVGSELPTTIVARCYSDVGVFTNNLDDCELGDQAPTPLPGCPDPGQPAAGGHGTIVAESLLDMAPGVSLYVADPVSRGDLQDTVEWMASQGVTVINYSVGWYFDGPGDGTSPFSYSPLNTVDRAVESDILWVNSAGNSAQDTWFGGYSNPDRDEFINFGGSDEEVIDIPLRACARHVVQLRWEDDWAGASTNLDLHLYRKSTNQVIFSSYDLQSGQSGQVPFEVLAFRARVDSNDFGIFVNHFGGEAPEWIQVTARIGGPIEHYTLNGSITNPAESSNPGMLAVGAAPWFDVQTIEPFSSQGPAPDGRTKPEIVGADCGRTLLRPLRANNRGFCGTSQASPHVAGMAALVRQRFPEFSAQQVATYLKTNAEARGTVPNNTWGYGFAQLSASDVGACGEAITTDGTTDGTWASGCQSQEEGRGYARYYGFTLAEQAEVTITVNSDEDSYLYLRSGDARSGTALNDHQGDDDAGGDRDAQIVETLDAGDYTIEATTFAAATAGTFTLTISGLGGSTTGPDPGPGPGTDACGEAITTDGTTDGTWASGCQSQEEGRGYARYYGFTLAEQAEVTITVNSDEDSYLYLRSGDARSGTALNDHQGDDDAGGDRDAQIVETLDAGDYTIEATTFAAATAGTFTLTISGLGGSTTGPDPGPGPGTDACGEAITTDGTTDGTWASGCQSQEEGRGYARYYGFTLAEQAEVTITVNSDEDSYLYLRSGDARSGTALNDHQGDDDAGGDRDAQIVETLDAGDYTIEATTFDAATAGTFTLTISGLGGSTTGPDPGPGPGTGACGEAITTDGTTDGTWASGCQSQEEGRGYARYYGFTLAEQAEVTITVNSDEDSYLYLRSGDARSGTALNDHQGDDDAGGDRDAQIVETLDAGDYTIEATTFDAATAGTFTLTISGLGGSTTGPDPGPGPGTDACGEAITTDGTTDGTWASGCQSQEEGRGYARYYGFTLAEQAEVTITVNSDEDSYLYLRSGDARSGTALNDHQGDDDAGGDGNAQIVETLDAGDYTIEATTFAAATAGTFTLTISGLGGSTTGPDPGPGPGTDACGEAITTDGTTDGTWASGCQSQEEGRGYARYYGFTLAEQAEVTITVNSDEDSYLYLRSGDARSGTALNDHQGDDDAGGDRDAQIVETLDAGDYTIEATTFDAATAGTFTLTISGLGGSTTEPPTGDTVNEREALTALYNATDGANWENSSGWLTNAPLDQWYGVTTDDNGRVIEVDLLSNGLTGSVPAEVGNLYNLTLLRLDRNLFTGTLPSELGNLTNLNHLSITHSEIEGGLTGEIPPELGNLTELDTLYLGGHDLSGELPTELNNLTNLEQLVLWGNQFNGAIPSWMGNLTQLLRLELRSNQFSGPIPSELGNLTEMTRLQLGNNMLSGPIPTEMGNLRFLHILWLNDNQLTGSIPTQLENLTLLESLYLGGNQFTGCIPAALFAVPDNDLTRLYDLSACSS